MEARRVGCGSQGKGAVRSLYPAQFISPGKHSVGGAPSAAQVAGGAQQTDCIGAASAAISSSHDIAGGAGAAAPQPNSKTKEGSFFLFFAFELKVTVRAGPLPLYCLVVRSASAPLISASCRRRRRRRQKRPRGGR